MRIYWCCLPRTSVQSRHFKTIINPKHTDSELVIGWVFPRTHGVA